MKNINLKNNLNTEEKPKKALKYLGVLSLVVIFAVVAGFMILIGYYVWQIKYGDFEKVNKQFSDEYSEDKNLLSFAESIGDKDPTEVIRKNNPTFGNPDSEITIIVFIDFECPFCQRSYPIFKEITEKYKSAVKIVFKHLPLASIHPDATGAAHAAACAHEQKKFWPYYDKLFQEKKLDIASLTSYSKMIGIDQIRFEQCLTTKPYAKDIQQDIKDAQSLGLVGTPTYFINNKKIQGVIEKDAWDKIILQELQNL